MFLKNEICKCVSGDSIAICNEFWRLNGTTELLYFQQEMNIGMSTVKEYECMKLKIAGQ